MKQFSKYFACALAGLIIGVTLFFAVQANNRPDLEFWHTIDLVSELSADDINHLHNFEEYRTRENYLFAQLGQQLNSNIDSHSEPGLNRYSKESWSNQTHLPVNWNKTFELISPSARAGVLMLHGLSDSPYSMKSLAEGLHKENAWVLGLRLPGHGTVPAGLTHVDWQDFTAAVRLAARYLKRKTGDAVPLYLVGYSNGAALALEYTFSQMLGEKLPQPAGLVLISPAVAVSPTAALARLNLLFAYLTGLQKLAWLSIEQEYDPYKYNSFAINAGYQIYQLTKRLNSQIKKLDNGTGIEHFPPVIAFQSVVDSTIPPFAIAEKFMNHLAPGDHELVLFDVNRTAADMSLIKNDPKSSLDTLMAASSPFAFSLITNQKANPKKIEKRHKKANNPKLTVTPIELEWPKGVYSLSHVALPFKMEDPIYGAAESGAKGQFTIGSLEARGEKGVLQASIADLMRLRYNPFYSYLEEQTVNWIFKDRGH